MSHRRLAEQERGTQPAPIAVLWAMPEPVRFKAGHCPRCGSHIGRALRSHTKICDGTPVVVTPETPAVRAAEHIDVMVGG